jgi:hypothetical protein
MRLRQRDVSATAAVSRSLIAAIDRGELDGVTLGMPGSVVDAGLGDRGCRLATVRATVSAKPGAIAP